MEVSRSKVVKVSDDTIYFDNGAKLYSEHERDCCEHHYLCMENISIKDFEGLEFDLSNDSFFERIDEYGIALLPIVGHPVRIPGYGDNNGYYSSQLDLVLKTGSESRVYDVTECQVIEG